MWKPASFPKGKRKKKWTGWKPKTDEPKNEFEKKVMKGGEDRVDADLAIKQKTTETATCKVAPHTKAERETIFQSTPENVRLREQAAARCTIKNKRRVLKNQARKTRAGHLVKCCWEPGKMKAKRKPFTELCVKGNFTEDREEWQKELQRHCEEVCADHEETKEVQENRIDCFKKKRLPVIHCGRS